MYNWRSPTAGCTAYIFNFFAAYFGFLITFFLNALGTASHYKSQSAQAQATPPSPRPTT